MVGIVLPQSSPSLGQTLKRAVVFSLMMGNISRGFDQNMAGWDGKTDNGSRREENLYGLEVPSRIYTLYVFIYRGRTRTCR